MPASIAYILGPKFLLGHADYQARLCYLGFLDLAYASKTVALTDDPHAATGILAPITDIEYGLSWFRHCLRRQSTDLK